MSEDRSWVTFARKGAEHLDQRQWTEAARAYDEAVARGGATWQLWADVGIAAKKLGAFRLSFEACARAIAGGAPPEDGSSWNRGIAATALGAWDAAREAWARCGLSIPPGPGEPRLDLGRVGIRLTSTQDEIVWCRRIDPARAVIESVPVHGRRHGDVVLHDGERWGTAVAAEPGSADAAEVPIFDELALLAPSRHRIYVAKVSASAADDVEDLLARLAAAGHVGEDWTRAPLHGVQGVASPPRSDPAWAATRMVGIASTQRPTEALAEWIAARPGSRTVHAVQDPGDEGGHLGSFEAMVRACDWEAIESWRPRVTGRHLPDLGVLYDDLDTWNERCALLQLVQDHGGADVKRCMLHFLGAPQNPENENFDLTKAAGIGTLEGRADLFTALYADRKLLASKVAAWRLA